MRKCECGAAMTREPHASYCPARPKMPKKEEPEMIIHLFEPQSKAEITDGEARTGADTDEHS